MPMLLLGLVVILVAIVGAGGWKVEAQDKYQPWRLHGSGRTDHDLTARIGYQLWRLDTNGHDDVAGNPLYQKVYLANYSGNYFYHLYVAANDHANLTEAFVRLQEFVLPCHGRLKQNLVVRSLVSLMEYCHPTLKDFSCIQGVTDGNLRIFNISEFQPGYNFTYVDHNLRNLSVAEFHNYTYRYLLRSEDSNDTCPNGIKSIGVRYPYGLPNSRGYKYDRIGNAETVYNQFFKKSMGNGTQDYLFSIVFPIQKCATGCAGIHKTPMCDEFCDFEKEERSWVFKTLDELDDYTHHLNQAGEGLKNSAIFGDSKNDELNFRRVVGSSKNNISNHYAYYSSKGKQKNVPVIVSPYYQHSSEKCELSMSYRIIGTKGAELIVTSQFISHRLISDEHISQSEDEDWTNPVMRFAKKAEDVNEYQSPDNHLYDKWIKDERIHIGEFMYPTRLRIECHDSPYRTASDKEVECYVDDLRFVDCDEEIWQVNKCESTLQRKYLCARNSVQKCIDYSDICDMKKDCPGGEDEDEEIHSCVKSLPTGARCDFEDTTQETGCKQWRFHTHVFGNNTLNWHLIELRNATKPKLNPNAPTTLIGLPATDHTFEYETGANRTKGHYLFFSTYGDEAIRPGFERNQIIYSYIKSPWFPPTNGSIEVKSHHHYRTCMVRFFYCHTGSSIFQLLLVRKGNEASSERLWMSGDGSPKEPCIWEKASVVLPHIPTEYYLKINIAKMGKKGMSFSIDDFSMTPNCFLNWKAWNEKYVPEKVELSTCNTTGPNPPSKEKCDDPAAVRRSFLIPRHDPFNHKTLASNQRQYRIELHGASGGKLPNQNVNNNGGLVILNIGLSFGSNISFVLGQMGESPCDKKKRSRSDVSTRRFYDLVCLNKTTTDNQIAGLRNDTTSIPGTGGGGATILLIDGVPIAIAGGGGGIISSILFPEAYADGNVVMAEGGRPESNETHIRQKRYAAKAKIEQINSSPRKYDTPEQASAPWFAGYGGSFIYDDARDNCTECQIMHGKIDATKNTTGSYLTTKAGICAGDRKCQIYGGYGGGGASCGPGGGGGAGYRGGRSTHKNVGEGGTSAVLKEGIEAFFFPSINEGDGKVVIRACSKQCPPNSTCRFEPGNPGLVPKEYCKCDNGIILGKNEESCEKPTTSTPANKLLSSLDSDRRIQFFLALLIALLVILLIACITTICCCFFRRRRQNTFDWPKEMQLIAGAAASGPGDRSSRSSSVYNGNRIAGNPLYEDWYFQSTTMPHISRHFIKVVKTIGHGAFGEVFEGIFQFADEGYCRVAIKALPADSGPDVIEDFQTEAKLLNRFQHDNIVKFFGVSFEAQPRFIILELLEGGDLKNYLRENRPKPAERDQPQLLKMLDLIEMALDVARGCEYLEQNKFVHRDIAARNCLLSTKDLKDRVVKIADFGMARDIYRNDYYRKGGRAFLPVKWMPPEAFLDGIFTTKTDVWAYGVLLWEIFSMGYMPYTGRPNQEVMQLVVRGGRLDPPNGIPDEVYKFMIKCWDTEALQRPSFGEIVDFLLAQDPQIREEPLPPICSRVSMKTPSDTPSTTRSSAPPGESDSTNQLSTISQGTISTMLGSMTESTSSAYDSMPTKGEGVSNVCPPYVQKFPKSPIQMRQLERIASGDSTTSSQDDSTLHDTGSVKRSPYRIDKNVDFPSTLKTLQNQAPGSRTPLVVPEGSGIAHSSPPNNRNSILREERKSLLMDEPHGTPPARNSLILNSPPPALPPKSVAASFATSIHANSAKNNKMSRSKSKSSTEDEKMGSSRRLSPKTGSQHPSQLI